MDRFRRNSSVPAFPMGQIPVGGDCVLPDDPRSLQLRNLSNQRKVPLRGLEFHMRPGCNLEAYRKMIMKDIQKKLAGVGVCIQGLRLSIVVPKGLRLEFHEYFYPKQSGDECAVVVTSEAENISAWTLVVRADIQAVYRSGERSLLFQNSMNLNF